MKKYIIYYRNSNGNTETFRVISNSDLDAINRFHKVIGYYPIVKRRPKMLHQYNRPLDFSADSCIIVPMMINKEIVLKFSIVDLCSDLMWVGLLFGICYLFVWSV